MACESLQFRPWLSLLWRLVFVLVSAAILTLPAVSPAKAQYYERRGGAQFFDPFGIFGPMFRREPRPPRDYRGYREYPDYRRYRDRPMPPQSRAPSPAVDNSKAPPPRKRDTPATQTVVVLGGSLADWLAYGLDEAYADRPEIGIVRNIHPLSGLIRFDSKGKDWAEVARNYLKDQPADVVVMLVGLSDRVPIHIGKATGNASAGAPTQSKDSGETVQFRTDAWAAAYSALIDKTIAALKSKGVPVIWVGLPSIRGTKSTSDMIYLNDLFRARAERAGIIYADVWDGFVDDSGRFTTYGPDVEGQVRRLRTSEGVYFTKAGARKLAHYVEREINRVMGTKLPAVATTTPNGAGAPSSQPGAPAARPVAGPVVPLTETAGSNTLVGGNGQHSADPLAAQVLVKGDAVPAAKGRADDFSLASRGASEAASAAKSKISPAPASAAPANP